MRIGVCCGGPSNERGISLNSARSLLDHLTPLGVEVVPFYADCQKNFYRLQPSQLYSNTPSDFDFKLAAQQTPLSQDAFLDACRNLDLVFPAIHGAFGEDGELQSLLEARGIPFVGSPSRACRLMFDKSRATAHLAQHGFATLPSATIRDTDSKEDARAKLDAFFRDNHIDKAVLKPTAGGSSLGVATVDSPEGALSKARALFAEGRDRAALIEPLCRGREFTVLVLQNPAGQPVALLPTEIELAGEESPLFTFRHKYLPTCHVSYHCPPRFSDETVGNIQKAAEVLFSFFEMRDFARLDGWLMPNGQVIFSDFNPISGMEQNSFLFIQGSRAGLTHSEMLGYIVASAARRHGLTFEPKPLLKRDDARKVHVLFGGATAERQVSLMSGTNVWLKLRQNPGLKPEPYLLTPDGEVWKLPYSATLHHTVEETLRHCDEQATLTSRMKMLVPPLRARLGLSSVYAEATDKPRQMSLDAFCQQAQRENAFVFLGLHGGVGENGTIQKQLEAYGLSYNGAGPEASARCADKSVAGKIVGELRDPSLIAADKVCFALDDLRDDRLWMQDFYARLASQLKSHDLLVKPQSDGCSTGVARLGTWQDLDLFVKALRNGTPFLPPGTLSRQESLIELPSAPCSYMVEPFIETDEIRIEGESLIHTRRTDWIELTCGVIEQNGILRALTPSITVAEGNVLSLEEKFQGGTGVNLTPPPEHLIKKPQLALIRSKVEKAARALGIEGYARIDLFFNCATNQTMMIEANTLPGLTAATVIFHQAFAETQPLTPELFLAALVEAGFSREMRRKDFSRHAATAS